MSERVHRPEWVPEDAGEAEGFTTNIMAGVKTAHDGLSNQGSTPVEQKTPPRRRELTVEEYVNGVRSGDRTLLARAITLVESNAA